MLSIDEEKDFGDSDTGDGHRKSACTSITLWGKIHKSRSFV